MICEIIQEPKGARGFGNLGAYIVGAEKGVDPASWERLTSYVIGEENTRGEIVSDVAVHNLPYETTEVGLAVKHAMALNERCITSKAPKTMHFIISLPPSEVLTPEEFATAEQRYIDAFGLQDCARISVTHNSKDHLHRHVAVATASTPDAKNKHVPFGRLKALDVSAALEREFGLTPTNHDRGTGKARVNLLLEHAKEHAPEMLAAKTWQDLHRTAAEHGMAVKKRGDGLTIKSTDSPRLHVKASKVHRELGINHLEAKLGPYDKTSEEKLLEAHRDFADRQYRFYSARIRKEMILNVTAPSVRRENIMVIMRQRDAAIAKRRSAQKREREQLREQERVV